MNCEIFSVWSSWNVVSSVSFGIKLAILIHKHVASFHVELVRGSTLLNSLPAANCLFWSTETTLSNGGWNLTAAVWFSQAKKWYRYIERLFPSKLVYYVVHSSALKQYAESILIFSCSRRLIYSIGTITDYFKSTSSPIIRFRFRKHKTNTNTNLAMCFSRHCRQNLWPHLVRTGSRNGSWQIKHCKSSSTGLVKSSS